MCFAPSSWYPCRDSFSVKNYLVSSMRVALDGNVVDYRLVAFSTVGHFGCPLALRLVVHETAQLNPSYECLDLNAHTRRLIVRQQGGFDVGRNDAVVDELAGTLDGLGGSTSRSGDHQADQQQSQKVRARFNRDVHGCVSLYVGLALIALAKRMPFYNYQLKKAFSPINVLVHVYMRSNF